MSYTGSFKHSKVSQARGLARETSVSTTTSLILRNPDILMRLGRVLIDYGGVKKWDDTMGGILFCDPVHNSKYLILSWQSVMRANEQIDFRVYSLAQLQLSHLDFAIFCAHWRRWRREKSLCVVFIAHWVACRDELTDAGKKDDERDWTHQKKDGGVSFFSLRLNWVHFHSLRLES
jgi:hypothetical protein